jgi:hypothetical protein
MNGLLWMRQKRTAEMLGHHEAMFHDLIAASLREWMPRADSDALVLVRTIRRTERI